MESEFFRYYVSTAVRDQLQEVLGFYMLIAALIAYLFHETDEKLEDILLYKRETRFRKKITRLMGFSEG